MKVTTHFTVPPNVTMKVGDPVHDDEGNVIGEVLDWKQVGDRIDAAYKVDDAMADKIRGKTTTFSMGTAKPGG